MITKEWRDYKWEFRPLVVLAWCAVSPVVVLPLIWIWSRDWCVAAVEVDWAAWVQAISSGAGIWVAVWLFRQEQRKHGEDEARRALGLSRKLYYTAFEISGHVDQIFTEGDQPKYNDSTIALFEALNSRVIGAFAGDDDRDRIKYEQELRQNLLPLIANLKLYCQKQVAGKVHFLEARNYYRGMKQRTWELLSEVESNLPEADRTPKLH